MSEPTTEELSVDERAEALKLAALASHGYLGEDGEILDAKIEDVLFNKISTCEEVFKTSERKTKTLTRTVLTNTVVPNMPGPGDYQEAADPEAAEKAWSKVNELVWRMCDTNASGRIQSRFNGDRGLLMCRTSATADKQWGVYLTRNWQCIQADFVSPDQKKVERAIRQQSENGAMGSERLPEHGKKFRRELSVETKRHLEAGLAQIDRQLEMGEEPEVEHEPAEDGEYAY